MCPAHAGHSVGKIAPKVLAESEKLRFCVRGRRAHRAHLQRGGCRAENGQKPQIRPKQRFLTIFEGRGRRGRRGGRFHVQGARGCCFSNARGARSARGAQAGEEIFVTTKRAKNAKGEEEGRGCAARPKTRRRLTVDAS